MSGFVKKAVVWLGLNEEYPAEDRAIVESPRTERQGGAMASQVLSDDRGNAERSDRGQRGPVRAVGSSTPTGIESPPTNPALGHRAGSSIGDGSVRAVPIDSDSPRDERSGTVRAVAAPITTKPKVIIPKSFNDAQEIADRFKESNPVIVNMQDAERDLARRLIDFSSGLCYGLGGQMEKVAKHVYLLTPTDVEVSEEERERFSS